MKYIVIKPETPEELQDSLNKHSGNAEVVGVCEWLKCVVLESLEQDEPEEKSKSGAMVILCQQETYCHYQEPVTVGGSEEFICSRKITAEEPICPRGKTVEVEDE